MILRIDGAPSQASTLRADGAPVAGKTLRSPGAPVVEPPPVGGVAVDWIATGHLSPTSHRVMWRAVSDCVPKLRWGTSPTLVGASTTAAVTLNAGRVGDFTLAGLAPNTTYYARAVTNDVLSGSTVSWTTGPSGAGSFKFAFGTCSNNMLTPTWGSIVAAEPLFLLHAGDRGYWEPVASDTADRIRDVYWGTRTFTAQHRAMMETVPVQYMWDGHDARTSFAERAILPTVRQVYREFVPHPPLVDADALYHSFTIGRVRFIMMDLYSYETDPAGSPSSARTRLGATQKAWVKQELLDAQSVHGCPVTMLVSTHSWYGDSGIGRWPSYATERNELGQFISDNDLSDRVLMLSGDVHRMGMDDGTGNPYGGFPNIVVAPLAYPANSVTLQGDWSQGEVGSGRYFGLITVTDNGGDVTVECSGRTETGTEVLSLDLTYPDL